MVLIRIITLHSLLHNVRVYAKHMRSKDNGVADPLSRIQFHRFRSLAPHMNNFPLDIPSEIWPIDKIWCEEQKQAFS